MAVWAGSKRGEKILFVVVLVVHVVMMSLGAWVHEAIGMSWVGVLVVANIILFSVKPESTEGGRRVSVLKRQEGAPVNLG